MTIFIKNFSFCRSFFFISLYIVLAQKYSSERLLQLLIIHSYFGFKQKHKNGKKIKNITITNNYKLSTTIIYTNMTNNDDIKQFQKNFHNDDAIKRSLMMILKV